MTPAFGIVCVSMLTLSSRRDITRNNRQLRALDRIPSCGLASLMFEHSILAGIDDSLDCIDLEEKEAKSYYCNTYWSIPLPAGQFIAAALRTYLCTANVTPPKTKYGDKSNFYVRK